MKAILTCCILALVSSTGRAQESREKAMEARAREMFRAIQSPDKEVWRKFVVENYTQALIDKPMREQREKNGTSETQSTAAATPESRLDAKVKMFERLHGDFGSGKLDGLKTTGDNCEVIIVAHDGLTATLSLKFETAKPWLISGIGIEARN